jgi:carbon monoxide dehydrogenase subunit G
MSILTAETVIDAPADQVWQVVAHEFDRIGGWATVVPSSAPIAAPTDEVAAAGRVCHTGLAMAPEVTETILAIDHHARTLTYEATDGTPRWVTRARNKWRVTPITATRTKVSFQAQLHVRGLIGVLARRWLLAVVARDGRHLLADLTHYIEHGQPSPRKQARLDYADDPVLAVGQWPTTRRLRAALRANAVLSLLCGVLLVAGGWFAAGPLGIRPAIAAPLAGAALVGFAVGVAWLAVQPAARARRGALLVVAADIGWVAGSAGLLVSSTLNTTGTAVVAGLAAAVAVLAAWQLAGIATTAAALDPHADLELVQASRMVSTPPDRVWPVLSDHTLFGRLAPNLSKVEVINEPGERLKRRCTNTAGRGWTETCTLWDNGRRFAVHVDTRTYPYPLELMRGLWQVDEVPGGHNSRIIMRFAYQATPTIRGGLFAIALHILFPRSLRQIFQGWQKTLDTIDQPTPARAWTQPCSSA